MSTQQEGILCILRSNKGSIVLLLLLGLVESCVFLGIQNGFWFDDDATLFAFASTVENPVSFFISKKVIAASGFSLTPLQMLSYWLDYAISGTTVILAYYHNIAAFLFTNITLFLVLRCWTGEYFAFFVTLAWMLLPSTIAVHEFIGTRHYMEGLFLSLIAIFCSYLNTNSQENDKRAFWAMLSLIFLTAAMLSKELYVTSTLLAVFLLYLHQRRYTEAAGTIAVGGLYTGYRIWAVGLTNNYPTQHMDVHTYLGFLGKTVYVFSGNYLGYALASCVLLYSLFLIWQKRFPFRGAGIAVLFIAINLATIYPGSSFLANEWQSHGTWYRLPFLLNLVVLLSGSLLFYAKKPFLSGLMMFLLFVSLIPGAYTTHKIWRQLKDRYSVTGRYYVSHPNALVYSELPAYWYLGGLKALYHLNHPFVLSVSPQTFKYAQAEQIREIWRYDNGVMIPDSKLWNALKEKYR